MRRTNPIPLYVVAMMMAAGATQAWAQSQPRDAQRGRDGQPRARDGQGEGRQRVISGEGFRGMGAGPGGGMGGMLERPEITKRDVEAMSRNLGLSEDQRESVIALWEGYNQEVRTMREEARAARERVFESFRDGGGPDPEVFRKMAEDQAAARAKRRKLDETLMNDLRSVLTPQQQPAWDSASRTLKRQQSLRMGMLSGERVDLALLVDELGLTEGDRKGVEPVLEQYSVDIDRELTVRDGVLGDDFNFAMMRDPEKREEMLGKIEKRRAAAEKVRDVNERFSRQISSVLPEDKRSAFESAYRRAKFPQVYRASNAQEALDAASRFDDLSTEQRDAISALRDRYSTRLSQIQPRHEKALVDFETNFNLQQVFRGGERDLEGEAMRTIRLERRDLDDSTMKDLRAILTADQIDRLPEPEQQEFRRGPGGRRGPGMTDGF